MTDSQYRIKTLPGTGRCSLAVHRPAEAEAGAASDHPLPAAPRRATLNQVLESFCQTGELVAAHPGPVLEALLPALCEVVLSPSESAEGRFFSLRMISDVLHHLLYDPQLYGSMGPTGGGSRGSRLPVCTAARGCQAACRQALIHDAGMQACYLPPCFALYRWQPDHDERPAGVHVC